MSSLIPDVITYISSSDESDDEETAGAKPTAPGKIVGSSYFPHVVYQNKEDGPFRIMHLIGGNVDKVNKIVPIKMPSLAHKETLQPVASSPSPQVVTLTKGTSQPVASSRSPQIVTLTNGTLQAVASSPSPQVVTLTKRTSQPVASSPQIITLTKGTSQATTSSSSPQVVTLTIKGTSQPVASSPQVVTLTKGTSQAVTSASSQVVTCTSPTKTSYVYTQLSNKSLLINPSQKQTKFVSIAPANKVILAPSVRPANQVMIAPKPANKVILAPTVPCSTDSVTKPQDLSNVRSILKSYLTNPHPTTTSVNEDTAAFIKQTLIKQMAMDASNVSKIVLPVSGGVVVLPKLTTSSTVTYISAPLTTSTKFTPKPKYVCSIKGSLLSTSPQNVNDNSVHNVKYIEAPLTTSSNIAYKPSLVCSSKGTLPPTSSENINDVHSPSNVSSGSNYSNSKTELNSTLTISTAASNNGNCVTSPSYSSSNSDTIKNILSHPPNKQISVVRPVKSPLKLSKNLFSHSIRVQTPNNNSTNSTPVVFSSSSAASLSALARLSKTESKMSNPISYCMKTLLNHKVATGSDHSYNFINANINREKAVSQQQSGSNVSVLSANQLTLLKYTSDAILTKKAGEATKDSTVGTSQSKSNASCLAVPVNIAMTKEHLNSIITKSYSKPELDCNSRQQKFPKTRVLTTTLQTACGSVPVNVISPGFCDEDDDEDIDVGSSSSSEINCGYSDTLHNSSFDGFYPSETPKAFVGHDFATNYSAMNQPGSPSSDFEESHLRIQSVFSLTDLMAQNVESDENEKDVISVECNENNSAHVESDQTKTFNLYSTDWKNHCTPCFIVLERLSKDEVKTSQSGNQIAKCSNHCRKRHLDSLCYLNLLMCNNHPDIDFSTLNKKVRMSAKRKQEKEKFIIDIDSPLADVTDYPLTQEGFDNEIPEIAAEETISSQMQESGLVQEVTDFECPLPNEVGKLATEKEKKAAKRKRPKEKFIIEIDSPEAYRIDSSSLTEECFMNETLEMYAKKTILPQVPLSTELVDMPFKKGKLSTNKVLQMSAKRKRAKKRFTIDMESPEADPTDNSDFTEECLVNGTPEIDAQKVIRPQTPLVQEMMDLPCKKAKLSTERKETESQCLSHTESPLSSSTDSPSGREEIRRSISTLVNNWQHSIMVSDSKKKDHKLNANKAEDRPLLSLSPSEEKEMEPCKASCSNPSQVHDTMSKQKRVKSFVPRGSKSRPNAAKLIYSEEFEEVTDHVTSKPTCSEKVSNQDSAAFDFEMKLLQSQIEIKRSSLALHKSQRLSRHKTISQYYIPSSCKNKEVLLIKAKESLKKTFDNKWAAMKADSMLKQLKKKSNEIEGETSTKDVAHGKINKNKSSLQHSEPQTINTIPSAQRFQVTNSKMAKVPLLPNLISKTLLPNLAGKTQPTTLLSQDAIQTALNSLSQHLAKTGKKINIDKNGLFFLKVNGSPVLVKLNNKDSATSDLKISKQGFQLNPNNIKTPSSSHVNLEPKVPIPPKPVKVKSKLTASTLSNIYKSKEPPHSLMRNILSKKPESRLSGQAISIKNLSASTNNSSSATLTTVDVSMPEKSVSVRGPSGEKYKVCLVNNSGPVYSMDTSPQAQVDSSDPTPSSQTSGSSLVSLLGTRNLPTRYADENSPLAHVPACSSLLPQRKVSAALSVEEKTRKRRLLEAKYPLPPGVIIKSEPDEAPEEELLDLDPSSDISGSSGRLATLIGNIKSYVEQNNSRDSGENDNNADGLSVESNDDEPPTLIEENRTEANNIASESDTDTAESDIEDAEMPPVLQPMFHSSLSDFSSENISTPISSQSITSLEAGKSDRMLSDTEELGNCYTSSDVPTTSSSSDSLIKSHIVPQTQQKSHNPKIQHLKDLLEKRKLEIERMKQMSEEESDLDT